LLLGRHRTCKGVTKALLGHRIKALLLLGHLVKTAKATTEATLLTAKATTEAAAEAALLTAKAATKARLTTKAAEAALLEHTAHR
jgi:hypothetical protein